LTTVPLVYDATWKYGILQDLKDIGLTRHLPAFYPILTTGTKTEKT